MSLHSKQPLVRWFSLFGGVSCCWRGRWLQQIRGRVAWRFVPGRKWRLSLAKSMGFIVMKSGIYWDMICLPLGNQIWLGNPLDMEMLVETSLFFAKLEGRRVAIGLKSKMPKKGWWRIQVEWRVAAKTIERERELLHGASVVLKVLRQYGTRPSELPESLKGAWIWKTPVGGRLGYIERMMIRVILKEGWP